MVERKDKNLLLSFEKPSAQVFYNQSCFMVENFVGNPHDRLYTPQKRDMTHHHSLAYYNSFVECSLCGVLVAFQKTITVRFQHEHRWCGRYKEKLHFEKESTPFMNRNAYCFHCFNYRYNNLKIKILLKLSFIPYILRYLIRRENKFAHFELKQYQTLTKGFEEQEKEQQQSEEHCVVCQRR